MLTDEQIIEAARKCNFMIYEDDNMVLLSEPLTIFARTIESIVLAKPQTPVAYFRPNDKSA